ncbi:hypothetical protein L207DRAFT_586629 [Hyaloscypha variabilis F]|uniref:Uncharacterized protein n=1 Tax=Hyaloscypha variabilis (strain UAMH 11265 / GT02V1 / F) TaxID=1149755 RepID=A0A2J6REK6_HYAVF|nr:hypothetical protein L207DRAFT_586629 [Hyaloscypha variabilis F]
MTSSKNLCDTNASEIEGDQSSTICTVRNSVRPLNHHNRLVHIQFGQLTPPLKGTTQSMNTNIGGNFLTYMPLKALVENGYSAGSPLSISKSGDEVMAKPKSLSFEEEYSKHLQLGALMEPVKKAKDILQATVTNITKSLEARDVLEENIGPLQKECTELSSKIYSLENTYNDEWEKFSTTTSREYLDNIQVHKDDKTSERLAIVSSKLEDQVETPSERFLRLRHNRAQNIARCEAEIQAAERATSFLRKELDIARLEKVRTEKYEARRPLKEALSQNEASHLTLLKQKEQQEKVLAAAVRKWRNEWSKLNIHGNPEPITTLSTLEAKDDRVKDCTRTRDPHLESKPQRRDRKGSDRIQRL